MGTNRSKQVCECCKADIKNQRVDSRLCRDCKAYMRKCYGSWKTNENRDIKKCEDILKKCEDILKKVESFDKNIITEGYAGALKKDRQEKQEEEAARDIINRLKIKP
jgi:hypothetical protein